METPNHAPRQTHDAPEADNAARKLRIVNGWSNHRGLSAWNLWLNNEWVMFRYYERTGYQHGKTRRHYLWQITKAFVLGWTPWQIRLRRLYVYP